LSNDLWQLPQFQKIGFVSFFCHQRFENYLIFGTFSSPTDIRFIDQPIPWCPKGRLTNHG